MLPTSLCGPVLLPRKGAVLSMGGPTHLFEVWAYIEKLELVLCCNLRSVLVLCLQCLSSAMIVSAVMSSGLSVSLV